MLYLNGFFLKTYALLVLYHMQPSLVLTSVQYQIRTVLHLQGCMLHNSKHVRCSVKGLIYRGYYTLARRYDFYVLVARTISHSFAPLTREILVLPREHKIHIFEPTCNVLFIIWRNQFNKSKKRESWRHWTIRHSRRWHAENTPLGSRMKWRMESTSGLVPSKTLSSI